MITDAAVARSISELMLDIFYRIDESIANVKRLCPAEEATAYGKAVGNVAGPIVLDVLEPLYHRHPELKPRNWDEEPMG